MKSALVTAFKAFVSQVRENNLEMAKKTVEKNGYKVVAVVANVKKQEQ